MKRFLHVGLGAVALWVWVFFVGLEGSSRLTFSNRSSAINLKSGSKFTVGASVSGVTGSIIKNSGATVTGNTISFEHGGSFEDEGTKVALTGSLNPTTNKFVLDGSKTLRAEPGSVLKGVSISGSGNRLTGQPIFTDSISFEANATATFALQEALTQNIEFDAGGSNTLRLESDLRLVDDVTIVNNGTIDVNGRRFAFGGKNLTLANTIYWENAGDISLSARVDLSGTWEFKKTSVVNGNGNIIDVSTGGIFSLDPSVTLYMTDVVLKGVGNSTFVFGDDGSTIRFSNVDIQFDENVNFNGGKIYVDGPATAILHDYVWAFSSDSKLTVDSVTFWKDRAGSSLIGNISFESDATNYSSINSGTIKEVALADWVRSTSNAVVSLDGRMDTAEDFLITNSNAIVAHEDRLDTAEAFLITNSDAIVAHEGRLDTAEAFLITNSNAIVTHEDRLDTAEDFLITNSDAIVAHEDRLDTAESFLITNSDAIVAHEGRLDTAEINISTNASNISTNSTNITNTYNYLDNRITQTMDEIWQQIGDLDVTALEARMDTAESFLITNSNAVVATNNHLRFIHGPNDYTLTSNLTLTVDLWLSNNHKLIFGSDLVLDGNGHAINCAKDSSTLFDVGSTSLTLQNVVLDNFDPALLSLTSGSIIFGDGTRLKLSDNIFSQNYTMTFAGLTTIDGGGHDFNISSLDRAMDVLPGATLQICNARITGLGGAGDSGTNNLRCIGPDSTLTLTNCSLVLDNNFSFTQGVFDIYDDVVLTGNKYVTFAYQSPQNLTIYTDSKLTLDRKLTFSYDSVSASKQKLVMQDESSVLYLNGCTLYSTRTGLQLEGGTVIVEDLITIRNEAQVEAEAMVFKHTLTVDVLAGATFDLADGIVADD